MLLNKFVRSITSCALLLVFSVAASSCSTSDPVPEFVASSPDESGGPSQANANRVAVISGLLQPEAVRYDAETDSYYISNFNGSGSAKDENGFITRVDAESGEVVPRFAVGSAHPLHAPRGMYIVDNVLWAADVSGVHGFDKSTGEQLQFIDFSSFENRFLNDVAADSNGTLYVTETGGRRVFRLQDGRAEVYLTNIPNPNGITYDGTSGALLIAPWDEADPVSIIDLETDSLRTLIQPESNKIDGIEMYDGRLILAAQSDSTILFLEGDRVVATISTDGKPADIAIDTRRGHIAVPYIALNRVDIWRLPQKDG